MLRSRAVLGLSALSVAGVAVGVGAGSDVDLALRGGWRTARTFATALTVLVDYKWTLRTLEYKSDAYLAAREAVHGRTAVRVLALARANQGMYVKMAQTVASMQAGIPKIITSTLAVMQDAAPFKEFADVEGTFQAEFGALPSEVFAEFAETPFAAASLAQVHEAKLRDPGPGGFTRVAVKVQHKGLKRMVETDLWAMRVIANLFPLAFEGLELGWIVDEAEENIYKELDFVREGRSAERARFAFEDMDAVRVPRIVWPLSSPKILTMEYMDGVSIGRSEALEAMGVDQARVRGLLVDTFARMIMDTGFIHCDPHPGNILVDVDPATGVESLVLLDHGLYREINDEFRINYCKLWVALVTFDEALLDEAVVGLGVAQYKYIFPLILTYRPWSRGGGSTSVTEEEAAKLRAEIHNTTVAEVFQFLEDLPRDMLLVFRSQDLMRSINKRLGGSSLDRFRAFVRAAIKGMYLYRDGAYVSPSWPDWLSYQWTRVRFELGIAAVSLASAARAFFSSILVSLGLIAAPDTSSSTLSRFERFRARQG